MYVQKKKKLLRDQSPMAFRFFAVSGLIKIHGVFVEEKPDCSLLHDNQQLFAGTNVFPTL